MIAELVILDNNWVVIRLTDHYNQQKPPTMSMVAKVENVGLYEPTVVVAVERGDEPRHKLLFVSGHLVTAARNSLLRDFGCMRPTKDASDATDIGYGAIPRPLERPGQLRILSTKV